MGYIVGIDGGGTKTRGLLAYESGKVIASTTAGPCNPNVVKEKELANVFKKLFSDLEQKCEDMREKTIALYAGISGAGNPENEKKIREIVEKELSAYPAVKVEVDAINALYAGTYGKPGMVQISGTGSITYGKNSQGDTGRVGGWGYLFGDEGSGYDIGRRAVIESLRAYDGRSSQTMLLNMLYAHFQVDSPQELIRYVYTYPSPKNKISPLAQIVFDAYKQGDNAAKKIINETTKDLALNITTLLKQLFPPSEKTPIVLSGGIFQEQEIIPVLLQKELNKCTNLYFVLPEMSPAGGALIGASLMKKNRADKEFIKNIIDTEGRR